MASCTVVLKKKRKNHARSAGHDRKLALAHKGTTPSAAVLFGDVKVEKTAE